MTLRVAHLITGLSVGGAELALVRLLAATDRTRISPQVIAFVDGPVAAGLRELDVPLHLAALSSRAPFLAMSQFDAIVSLLRRHRVEVLQTWMPHADLAGSLIGRRTRIPVVWGLRMSYPEAGYEKRSTRAVALLNRHLARRSPAAIVACSRAVAASYVAAGYPAEKIRVIPNGYDADGLRMAAQSRGPALRASLGIKASDFAIGRVGRWHRMKDYPTLLCATAPIMQKMPRLHLVLVGDGVDERNAELLSLIPGKIRNRVHLLGRQVDMPAVYGALDLVCSSSASGEGFPNVIAEALACLVPVVTTDVGESAAILHGDGVMVVPASDAVALGAALRKVITDSAQERERHAWVGAAHVRSAYSLENMSSAFADLHEEVSSRRHP